MKHLGGTIVIPDCSLIYLLCFKISKNVSWDSNYYRMVQAKLLWSCCDHSIEVWKNHICESMITLEIDIIDHTFKVDIYTPAVDRFAYKWWLSIESFSDVMMEYFNCIAYSSVQDFEIQVDDGKDTKMAEKWLRKNKLWAWFVLSFFPLLYHSSKARRSRSSDHFQYIVCNVNSTQPTEELYQFWVLCRVSKQVIRCSLLQKK